MAVTTVTFNLVSAAEVISKHGLDPNGRAQKFLTHQARVLMDPYVPFRSGTLKNSAVERPTSVNYVTPYARRQYYEHKGSGIRGPYWDKRMYAARGPELIKSVQTYISSM